MCAFLEKLFWISWLWVVTKFLCNFHRLLYNILMKFFTKQKVVSLLALFLSFLPSLALGEQIINPLSNVSSIPQLIKIFLDGIIKIGSPLIVLAVIYCGFLFVQAQGNSEKVTDAKKALFNTLIGAAILLGSWTLSTLISDTVKELGS